MHTHATATDTTTDVFLLPLLLLLRLFPYWARVQAGACRETFVSNAGCSVIGNPDTVDALMTRECKPCKDSFVSFCGGQPQTQAPATEKVTNAPQSPTGNAVSKSKNSAGNTSSSDDDDYTGVYAAVIVVLFLLSVLGLGILVRRKVYPPSPPPPPPRSHVRATWNSVATCFSCGFSNLIFYLVCFVCLFFCAVQNGFLRIDCH